MTLATLFNYWEIILHGSLTSFHNLQGEALTAYVLDYLFKEAYIGADLEESVSIWGQNGGFAYFLLGQRAVLLEDY